MELVAQCSVLQRTRTDAPSPTLTKLSDTEGKGPWYMERQLWCGAGCDVTRMLSTGSRTHEKYTCARSRLPSRNPCRVLTHLHMLVMLPLLHKQKRNELPKKWQTQEKR
jgi:hypothetical protein